MFEINWNKTAKLDMHGIQRLVLFFTIKMKNDKWNNQPQQKTTMKKTAALRYAKENSCEIQQRG